MAVKQVLVDGDILVYKSAWATQKTHWTHEKSGEFFDTKTKAQNWIINEILSGVPHGWTKKKCLESAWNDDDWSSEEIVEPFSNCRSNIDNIIQDIVNTTKAEDYKVFLSPSKNFRHELAVTTPYKDRKQPKPVHYEEARNYLVKIYHGEVPDNLEADDALGMHQTTDTAIASIDKDLLMIPGKHYNIDKKTKSMVSLEAANNFFLRQLLTGDPTDSIPGLPGIGDVKAEAIIKDFYGDHWGLIEEIKNLYEDVYPSGVDTMHEMAALLWILRRGETPETAGWRSLLGVEEVPYVEAEQRAV